MYLFCFLFLIRFSIRFVFSSIEEVTEGTSSLTEWSAPWNDFKWEERTEHHHTVRSFYTASSFNVLSRCTYWQVFLVVLYQRLYQKPSGMLYGYFRGVYYPLDTFSMTWSILGLGCLRDFYISRKWKRLGNYILRLSLTLFLRKLTSIWCHL